MKLLNNKRGDLTGLIYLIVQIAALAIFLLIVGYVAPQIATNLKTQIGSSASVNNSLDTVVNIPANTFNTIWIIVFGIMCLGLFVTSFFIETHPVFVPIFIFLLILTIFIAIPISNAYETLSANATLSTASAQQQLIYFIMTNLPFVAFIIGLISLIITFAKPSGSGMFGGTLG